MACSGHKRYCSVSHFLKKLKRFCLTYCLVLGWVIESFLLWGVILFVHWIYTLLYISINSSVRHIIGIKNHFSKPFTATVFQNRKQCWQSYFSQERLEETKQLWNTSCRGDTRESCKLNSPLCPAPTAATGDIPAYQLRSPNSGLAQSIVMAAASPSTMQSPSSQHAEEITRKREVRLMKNRWELLPVARHISVFSVIF